MTTLKMTDDELINGCMNNHAGAQKLLFEKFSKKMMGVCLRYVPDYDEAQDVLQESFIKVFQKIGSFESKGSLDGWIRKIIVNTALDHFRKNKDQKFQAEITEEDHSLATEASVVESINAKELLMIIQALPVGFRTVFNLYAIEGYSHKEIGVMLGISESTSKSQYARARVHLQKSIIAEQIIVS
jgi:RNA polymerase sigma factor (sigma-70 family)